MSDHDPFPFLRRSPVAGTASDPHTDRFRARWATLEAAARTVPSPSALVAAAVPPDSVRVATVHAGSELVGVWPLRIERLGPLRVALRAGGPLQVYDGPTLHPELPAAPLAARLWDAIGRWDDVDLVYLPAFLPGSAVASLPAIRAAALPRSRTARLRLAPLPDVQELIAQQPRHRRKSLRRRRRALERRGAVKAEVLTQVDARISAVEWALDTKIAWLDTHDAMGATVRSTGFRRTLLQLARRHPGLVVHRLQVGTETAAVELGFRDRTTYLSYLGTFSPHFAKDGAGVTLTLAAIDWCIAEGLETYDLLAPLTDFKQTWADQQRVVQAAAVPLSLAGKLAAPLFRDTRDRVKQLAERLPPWLRSELLTRLDRRGPSAR